MKFMIERIKGELEHDSTRTGAHVTTHNAIQRGAMLCVIDLVSSDPKGNCVISLMVFAGTPMSSDTERLPS